MSLYFNKKKSKTVLRKRNRMIHFKPIFLKICWVLLLITFLSFSKTNVLFGQNGEIGGSVWNDCNGNGLEDSGDLDLTMGVQVGLFNDLGVLISIQTTDAAGNYAFSNLSPGTYEIRFGILPNPYRLTLENIGGDENIDSDPDRTSGAVNGIVLGLDEVINNINAGYFELISISGFVFNDIFEDGIKNGDDQGKLSVSVELVDGCPDGDVIGISVTNVNGMYSFNNVPPGQITVRVVISPDLAMLVPTTALSYCLDIGCEFLPDTYDFGFAFNCDNPTTPSFPSCEAIDYVMCNLKVEMDGFCAEMPNFLTQPAPGNGCFVPHNMTWFAFTAGFGDYKIVVTPINCVPGLEANLGVQTGIYSDCSFTNLIACNGEPNTDKVELSSTNLIPGNTYYFFTDGFNRSQCNITLSIEGDFSPFQYDDPEEIEIIGDCDINVFEDICVNNELIFRVKPYMGTEELVYHWMINGDNGYNEEITLKRNNEITRTFVNPGQYQICVTVSNFCQTKDPICRTIKILEKKADSDQGLFSVCRESFPYDPNTADVNGKVFLDEYGNQWQGGKIEFFDADGSVIMHLNNHCGCDYYQILRVQEIFSESGNFNVALCPDELPYTYDNLLVKNNIYDEVITLSLIKTEAGCDSSVVISARILDMQGEIKVASCKGDEVTLAFMMNDSIKLNNDYDGLEYGWLHNGNVIGNDPILKTTRKGLFTLRVTIYKYDKECVHEFSYVIDPANLGAQPPLLKGQNSICLNNTEDYFYISSPIPGYTYVWTYPDTFKQVRYSLFKDSIFINWNIDTTANVCARANNGCGWSNYTCFQVSPKSTPKPTLFIPDSICVNTKSLIYTNSIDSIFNWNITGDTLISGKSTKKDSLDVEWETAGKKYISLIALKDGCPSIPTTDSLMVFSNGVPPVLNCISTNNTVIFTWSDPADAIGYNFNLSGGLSGVHSQGSTYTISGLPSEQTVSLDIEIISSNPCGNYNIPQKSCTTQNCVPPLVTINTPFTDICLDADSEIITLTTTTSPVTAGTGIFSGTGVNTSNNSFDPKVAGVGFHTISYNFVSTSDNCSANSSISIQVKPTPTAAFSVSDHTICVDSSLVIKYEGIPSGAQVTWTLPPGSIGSPENNRPFSLKWDNPGNFTIKAFANDNGCASDTVSSTIQVDTSMATPQIRCSSIGQNEITFNWDSVTSGGYEILINDVFSGIITETQYIESGLNVDTDVKIIVRAISNNLCAGKESSITCKTSSCPALEFSFVQDTIVTCQIFSPNILNLSAEIDGKSNPAELKWTSSCFECIDTSNNTFDLSKASVGIHKVFVSYTNGSCNYLDSIFIIIKQKPFIQIQLSDDTICVTETLQVVISKTTESGITYNWSSGSEYIQNIAGNTVFFKWPAEGNYNLRLSANLNGCISDEVSKNIIVQPELGLPDIQCAESLNAIQLSWTGDPCAEAYVILVDNLPVSSQITTTFSITDLVVGQSVDIQIQSISKCACPGATSLVKTCTTQDCPPVVISFPNDTISFCLSDTPQNQILSANISGGNSSGVVVWQGQGVTNGNIFSPTLAGEGNHQITAIYTSGSCNYFNTLTALVNNVVPPILTAEDTICYTEILRLSVSGINILASVEFSDGKSNIIESFPNNDFSFKWNTPGEYKISAFAQEKGCKSALSSISIVAEPELPPLSLKCTSTVSSITLDWTNIDCANKYIIEVNGLQQTDQINNIFTLQNLNPEQSLDFTVFAKSACACPDRSEKISCKTADCSPININISGPFTANIGTDIVLSIKNNNWSGINIDSTVWKSNNIVICAGNCQEISFKVQEQITIYDVQVFYNGGCFSSKSHTINPSRLTNITVPNIINVNSQSNNQFKIYTDDESMIVSNLSIYDRWGNLVFTSKNFNPNTTEIFWNGKRENREMVPGVYVYIIEYISALNEKKVLQGDVTLIK